MDDKVIIQSLIENAGAIRTKYSKIEWIEFFLFAILNVAGRSMYYNRAFPGNAWGWLLFFLESCWFFALAYVLYPYAVILIRYIIGEKSWMAGVLNISEDRFFFISAGIICLCWLPWVITFCPGSIEWDTYEPIMEFYGGWLRTNHHPWFYTCIVGTFYKLGVSLGSKELGMFLYILARNAFCIWIYSKICSVIYREVNHFAAYLVLLFYAVVPVWGAYAKHAFKDTLGAAVFSWFVLETVLIVRQLKEKDIITSTCIEFTASGALISMIRNNGVYVVLPVSVLAAIFAWKVNAKRAILLLMGVVLFLAYHTFIIDVLQIKKTSPAEALAIVQQQVARAVRDHRDELTEDELEAINLFQDVNAIGDNYDMLLSDPVKGSFGGNGKKAAIPYFLNWIKMFFRFPKTYVEAFIGQGYGYYAFTPREAEGAGNGNSGMTLFHWIKDSRFPNDITCDYVFALDPVRDFLANWASNWDKMPILNFTDSMPLYTWVIVFAGGILLKKKDWVYSIPILSLLIMILTCVASPVNGAFRYYCPVAASVPILFLLGEGIKQ